MQQWLNIASTVIIIIILKARAYLGDGRCSTCALRTPDTVCVSTASYISDVNIPPQNENISRARGGVRSRRTYLLSITFRTPQFFFPPSLYFQSDGEGGQRIGAWGMLAREKSGRGKIMACGSRDWGPLFADTHKSRVTRMLGSFSIHPKALSGSSRDRR